MTHRPFHNRGRRVFVDRFSIKDIPKTKGLFRQRLQFEWEFYSEVAFQRAQILDELKKVLFDQSAGPFKLDRWQRAVKYKYTLSPLNARGSLSDPGGRFNIGKIDPTRFAVFPALYLAKTKATAEDELLARNDKGSLFTAEEFALARTASITVISVSGEIERVLDIRKEKNLTNFVELTRHFVLSDKLKNLAKSLNLHPPRLITLVDELKKSLLDPLWRFLPMQMDIPSNPQLFGQIVMESGIGGVLYPSVLSGEDCLAIFPTCFPGTGSYLMIDDPVPKEVKCARLDAETLDDCL